jgi:hypothetical protein
LHIGVSLGRVWEDWEMRDLPLWYGKDGYLSQDLLTLYFDVVFSALVLSAFIYLYYKQMLKIKNSKNHQ